MNIDHYLNRYINHLYLINQQNEKKYFFHIEELMKPLKDTIKMKEMKDYENYMRIYKNDFLSHESRKENDEIFDESNINIDNDNEHIDFFNLSIESKKHHIINFLARKKYNLINENLDSLDELLENNELLKKMIHLSKTHSNIEKIDFIKKVEGCDYIIDLNIQEKKKISKKNYFKK